MKKTLAIIGGGAVGLSSAIHAHNLSKDNINIIILEKMDRVGKKILATGNGRCNFTNINTTYKNFYGKDKLFTKYFLEQFSPQDTIEFFYSLGVLHTVLENGKVYPYSEQASSILDALRNKIDSLNIPIKTEFDVKAINKKKSQFKIVSTKNETILADKIILATGGVASPNLGSNGSGIKILKSLGHSCTSLTPALVQLKTPPEKVKSLKGIKITGNLKMYNNTTFLKEEFGEILFTDYGISGPPVFQLSTLFARYNNLIAYIDFMPNFSQEKVFKILKDRKNILSYTNMENYFNGLLNKRLGNIIAKNSGIEKLSFLVKNLTDDMLKNMAYLIKNYKLPILDTNGFNNAQVTAGGINTDEFNNKTLESKIIKGLYCAGEILDVVGDCGGFNLQWAWSSSYVCTKACVEDIN
ncbi:BaiN/RdsA family NAD(P)/FAD-dependent oxidoreductase [[Clostridium] colinum]|uniref:NAD(P)/FAD-dependent oxidoreductase n=1 Tax=[Clostridium] colinum TaxID=36835 RepID=UPI00202507D8|nr:NAD(P)/FAD-dependent oxidoreductase [[Clostridium] colinum]